MIISLLIIGLAVWPVACVYIGFRLGRYTAGLSMPPIIEKKTDKAPTEEDPYYEPMYGKPQPRIPTMPGEE